MLAGEDLGRREQRRLRAGFDRGEHRQQRDQRLARADVALQQAQHRRRSAPCRRGFRRSPAAARRSAGRAAAACASARPCPGAAPSVPPLRLAQAAAAPAGWRKSRHRPAAARVAPRRARDVPRRSDARQARQPSRAARPGSIHSGSSGARSQRLARKLAQTPVGEPFGQRIDRLADRRLRPLARLGDLGVDDLPLVAIGFELARNDARLAHRAAAFRPARIVEKDEADRVAVRIGREHAQSARGPTAISRVSNGVTSRITIAAEQSRAAAGARTPFDRRPSADDKAGRRPA